MEALAEYIQQLWDLGVFDQEFAVAEYSAFERFINKVTGMRIAYIEGNITPSAERVAFCSVQTPVYRPSHA